MPSLCSAFVLTAASVRPLLPRTQGDDDELQAVSWKTLDTAPFVQYVCLRLRQPDYIRRLCWLARYLFYCTASRYR
uniref:Putative secreted protein n=1 Tax=Anopheles darlingi TaxID=43151 RepID=A0A2M4DB42_ANODA